jgi:N-acetylneuraminic acid mutarotase
MNKNTLTLVVLMQVCFLHSIILSPLVWAAEDSWTTLEPMPTARYGLRVAVVDGKIYAIEGYGSNGFPNVNEEYDPTTDTWATKSPMATPRYNFGIAVYQDKIYVFGGWGKYIADIDIYGLTGTTEVYDPKTDTWETKASIPTPRENVCASVVGDKIYLIGGHYYARYIPYKSARNEIYDPETDTWTIGASMPNYSGVGEAQITSAVVDNKIYMITDTFTQVYDPETDTWSSRATIPTSLYYPSAGATTGEYAPKRIHVLGTDTHQIYDPEIDSWNEGMPVPTPRYNMGVAVISDEIYAIGGYNGTARLAVNEKYTPTDYIPEFPVWTPLLLALTVLAVVVAIYKRRLLKSNLLTNDG